MKKPLLFSLASALLLSFCVHALPMGGLVVSYTSEKSFYRPGESGEIFITISNPTAYPLSDVDITLKAGSYIDLEKTELSLDNLPAGSSQQIGIIFTVNSSAQPTISYINVHVDYEDYGGAGRENDLVIPLKIYREPLLKAYVLELPEMKIGKSEKICFAIMNYGGEAKDVSITPSSDAVSFSPAQRFETSIKQISRVCFEAKPVTTEAGNYPVTLALNYYDALHENSYSEKFVYWVNVTGKIELTVYVEGLSENGNALNLVFSNSGSEDIKALHVRLSSDVELWPKEIYIGDLDRDDYDSERILLEKVPGRHKINVTAIFRDSFEREYRKTYSLQLLVPEEKRKESFSWIYPLLAGAVALPVLWRLRK